MATYILGTILLILQKKGSRIPFIKTKHFPNLQVESWQQKGFFAQARISPSVDHYKACSTPSPSGKTCDPSIQDPKLCRSPSLLTRASSSTRLAGCSPANYTSIISLCASNQRPPPLTSFFLSTDFHNPFIEQPLLLLTIFQLLDIVYRTISLCFCIWLIFQIDKILTMAKAF